MQLPVDEDTLPEAGEFAPSASIVPPSSVAGNALFFVVAIMAFLACITVGAVAVVAGAASQWRSDIASEITVQVRPLEGVDTAAAVSAVLDIASAAPGITGADALSDDEISALLEPWLGAAADLQELPVPRLVLLGVDRENPPDLARLRRDLAEHVPSASLDDHQLWQGRLQIMANTLVAGGLGVLGLVLAATVLSVVFATRGAMASNRDVVEVLHLVGAKEAFIARQFERHFLRLGLKGGLAGGTAAVFSFLAAAWIGGQFSATPVGTQIDAMFGSLSIGWPTIGGIVLTVLLVAGLTALTSRLAVFHFLRVFD